MSPVICPWPSQELFSCWGNFHQMWQRGSCSQVSTNPRTLCKWVAKERIESLMTPPAMDSLKQKKNPPRPSLDIRHSTWQRARRLISTYGRTTCSVGHFYFYFYFQYKGTCSECFDGQRDRSRKKQKSSKPCVLLLQCLHGYLRSNNLFSLHSILVSTNFAF